MTVERSLIIVFVFLVWLVGSVFVKPMLADLSEGRVCLEINHITILEYTNIFNVFDDVCEAL